MPFILLSTNVEAKDLVRAGQGILSWADIEPNMHEQAMIWCYHNYFYFKLVRIIWPNKNLQVYSGLDSNIE